jgi:hypothetical protein
MKAICCTGPCKGLGSNAKDEQRKKREKYAITTYEEQSFTLTLMCNWHTENVEVCSHQSNPHCHDFLLVAFLKTATNKLNTIVFAFF